MKIKGWDKDRSCHQSSAPEKSIICVRRYLPKEIRITPDGYAKAKETIGYIGGILAAFGVDYQA